LSEAPTWQWVVFIIFFILFPIVLHPWWLAILSIALFCLIAFLLKPESLNKDSELLTPHLPAQSLRRSIALTGLFRLFVFWFPEV
jgi:hypothetical protein